MSGAPSKKSETRKQKDGPDDIEVYFDVRDSSYWFQIGDRYVMLGKADLKIQLQTLGLQEGEYFTADAGRLDAITWVFWYAQKNRMIDFAGSLGGHRTGIFQDGSGKKYLVTDEARGVWDALPKKISTPKLFMNFITELLPDDADGGCQVDTFLHWLAIGLESMRKKDFRPGQVSVFAGPPECGKSFVQSIITEIFGGRSGSPARYMMEETNFNKDFAGTEHWPIEEPRNSTDVRSRIAFGAALKDGFNNQLFSIHGKGKEAITLPIFRRGTISVNDEPELLMVLPPLNGSNDDKLNLFRCAMVKDAFAPYTVDGVIDRQALWKAIVDEIPAIRAWLLKNYVKVPAPLANRRFGVKAYHHPDLRAELVSFTPESRLLALIDEAFYSEPPKDAMEPAERITGRVAELERKLRKSDLGFQFERLLDVSWKLGSYLGKLHKSQPDRVSMRKIDGYTHWTINPPSVTKDKTNEQ